MRAPDGLLRDFYDVAGDGQRFMVVVPDETATLAADVDRLARFQREAEILAALNHSNIAGTHGSGS